MSSLEAKGQTQRKLDIELISYQQTRKKNRQNQTGLSPGKPQEGSLVSGKFYKDLEISKIKDLAVLSVEFWDPEGLSAATRMSAFDRF